MLGGDLRTDEERGFEEEEEEEEEEEGDRNENGLGVFEEDLEDFLGRLGSFLEEEEEEDFLEERMNFFTEDKEALLSVRMPESWGAGETVEGAGETAGETAGER